MATVSETAAADKPQREFTRVARDNYVSREFAAQEKEHLWPKVWQVACREEEIPNVGDYIVYDVADDTIVVVRRPGNVFKAFFNVCPHRGRQIMEGQGHTVNFRCGYHNWTFDLEGKNIAVQDRQDWGDFLDKECIDLVPVKTGTWGGFVFINMDAECEPLEEYLAPVPEYLDPFEFEKMRIRWALELHIDSNWKTALEAFMEGYHVAATHSQLLPQNGDDYTTSFAHGKHSHFGYWDATVPIGQPAPRLKTAAPKDPRPGLIEFYRQMEETFGAIFTDRDYEAVKGLMDECPPDADPMTALGLAIELGRKAAEKEGCGYPPDLTPEVMFKAGTDWHIFPNCVTLPYFDGAVWYRARPDGDDPNKCIFNIYSLKRYAGGKEPGAKMEKHEDIKGKSFGLIVDQDVGNMKLVQKGMKCRGFRHALPNPVQEVEISNFHKHLEAYVLGQRRPQNVEK
ncbi:aromatic ring-hydroxylating oxygenase subunit alpha [Novosphingobium malaysiense]|uniref:(2Fe-2S)-binding protein n=1 Tax=Novosphingobium malaysiense TaxID=1348853 RepID=A0A0B1ZF63_9SPHN|nr:aromatic ring-hydroxylating dioxygenase subunit alpha [Novosphingobium malaysiense]KHK89110.1 (2Fe-2S)-binding protein [Novosphingobium malaysiense]